MKTKFLLACLTLFFGGLLIAAPEYQKKTAKTVFLRNMINRPWWNSKYQKRFPVLVSEPVGKKRSNAIVDFSFQAPSQIDILSVRVIDATGQEIPSQVEKNEQKIEIIFLTDLRPYEQKPFLVYYNSEKTEKSKVKKYSSDLNIKNSGKAIVIDNDKIEVEFREETKRPGRINKIRVRGSNTKNELSVMSAGGSWYGHCISPNQWFHIDNTEFSRAEIISNGPIKKTLKYSDKDLTIIYTLYSNSNLVNYEISSKNQKRYYSKTAWLVNGSSALDKIYYESTKGIKQLDGERNEILDSHAFYPQYSLRKWMKEGWLAIEDKDGRVTAGEFFDRENLLKCKFVSQGINAGENIILGFKIAKPVKGALVAMNGNWKDFRKEYINWKNPPIIHKGVSQEYNGKKQKAPGYLKNVTRGHKVEIHPLRDARRHDKNSAQELINDIKKYGGNSVKLSIQRRYIFPMSEKRLDKTSDDFKREYNIQKNYIKEICSAAHSAGIAVRYWFSAGNMKKICQKNLPFDENKIKQGLQDHLELIKAGVDYVYIDTGGEFHGKGFTGYGVEQLNKEPLFNKWTKFFYEKIKEKAPDIPVGILCSGSGSLKRYVDIEEKTPYLDTLETELVVAARPNLTNLKYGIRYPLGAFGNDGGILQHHFYFYKPLPGYRTGDMELPMIFGIKSFCCESLSNKLNNPELIEIVADFYRFIDYTGLENFIPEAKSIDYMGVIRDRNAFVNDIKKGKFRYLPIKMSEFESRCKNISSIKNMPLNIVVNRFAVAKNLNRYKIVFLPSDKVLDNKLATELLEYVKNGGCLITEGCSINNSLLAKAAGVRKVDESDYKTSKLIIKDKEEENVFAGRCFASLRAVEDSARIIGVDDQSRPSLFLKDYGKGKIIYSTYFLSDDLSKDCNKADFVRKLIRDRAGLPPVKVPSDYINILDTNLLADKNKYMLGVYNSSQSKKAECSLELNMKPAKEMYVLDLKNSRRTKFDGTIKVSIPPEKTGFFLIGDDSFTKIPEAKELPANNGYATVSGMTFHNLNNKYKYKIPSKEEIQVIGIFKPAKEKKPKSSSQNFGYKAIFDCLSEPGLKNISVKYLDDLSRKSLDGCNILIVPNIGLQRPKNLKPDWPENVREFVKQGGGAIILHHAVTDYNPFPEIASGTGTYNPAKTIRITAEHPLTKGLETGNTFQDTCWDYKELLPGKDGKVFLKGVPEKDWPAPVGVAGKVGKGKVLISGLGIGAGYRKNGHKTEKFEITPTGKLKKILINAVAWLTE